MTLKESGGAAALKTFLEERGIPRLTAGRLLGVSDAAIHEWIKGTRRPRHEQRLRIERWTSGAIPVSAWMSEDESGAVEAIEPFDDRPS